MDEPSVQGTMPKSTRLGFRFGMKGLLGIILVMGLVFGWLAHMRRQGMEREILVTELASERILVNFREPTLLCRVLTKLRGSRSILPGTPDYFSRWLGAGWFSRPIGFNAGTRLRDADIPRLVERLHRLGRVHEVRFQGGTLNGLRLFYIDEVPYDSLGPESKNCLVKAYP